MELDEKYDVVISQAVLRRVNEGEKFLEKMIAFGLAGALVVCIEANREFEEDGLYIKGMDYGELCMHDGFSALWKTELKKQGRDYAIAMKIPHYMKKYGLKNVDMRMNDRVTYLEPEQITYKEIFSAIIDAEGCDVLL